MDRIISYMASGIFMMVVFGLVSTFCGLLYGSIAYVLSVIIFGEFIMRRNINTNKVISGEVRGEK